MFFRNNPAELERVITNVRKTSVEQRSGMEVSVRVRERVGRGQLN